MLRLSYALRTNLPTNWRMAGHEAKVHRWIAIVGHRLRTIQRWICPSVVNVMVRQFSGEFEFIIFGDNQFQWWSDNSPVNCQTQAQDNSAVNLPKRGDCDGPTIQRWIRIHMWWQPISVMVRQFTGELSDTGSGQFSGESAQAWWQIQWWTFVPRSAPMNKETSVHIGRLVRSFICPIELKCDLKQHLQFQTSIWTHMFCVQGVALNTYFGVISE